MENLLFILYNNMDIVLFPPLFHYHYFRIFCPTKLNLLQLQCPIL